MVLVWDVILQLQLDPAHSSSLPLQRALEVAHELSVDLVRCFEGAHKVSVAVAVVVSLVASLPPSSLLLS